MDDKQFFIDHSEVIQSIKKRAAIRALAVFVGINLLSAFLFEGGFYVLLPFTLLWGFGIYSNTKQRLLHQQFPDKFKQPKFEAGDYSPIQTIDPSTETFHPSNPLSSNYWGKIKHD